MSQDVPAEPPPSYDAATSSAPHAGRSSDSHLHVPDATSPASERFRMPSVVRRSIEDQSRRLPSGWVRSFDPESHHHFYVDTTKDPPRSIWVHPFDDDQYLSTLTAEERAQIDEESLHRGAHPSRDDVVAAHSDEEGDHSPSSSSFPELPARPDGKGRKKSTDGRSFARKWKDKITGTTPEQREQERQRREQVEKEAYERHKRIREAAAEAQRLGCPVFIGKDHQGKDVYVEPPADAFSPGGGAAGLGYGPRAVGYNAYLMGDYSTSDTRYIRPQLPYSRPAGYGYGRGYGFPLGFGVPLMLGGGMAFGGAGM